MAAFCDRSSGARPINIVTEKVTSDVLKLNSQVELYNPDTQQLVGRRDDGGIPKLDLDKDEDDEDDARRDKSAESLVYSFDKK